MQQIVRTIILVQNFVSTEIILVMYYSIPSHSYMFILFVSFLVSIFFIHSFSYFHYILYHPLSLSLRMNKRKNEIENERKNEI